MEVLMRKLALVAAVGTAVVAVHGLTNRKWTEAHTFFLVLGLVAFLGGGGTAGLSG
jgi:hypothetical protein